MLMDLQNTISDDQSIAQVAGTYVGTNIIDLVAPQNIPSLHNDAGTLFPPIADIGRGWRPPDLLVEITTAVTSAGAATVEFQICQSANNDLSAPDVLQTSGAIGKATLIVGYQVPIGLGLPFCSKRYFGMQYLVAVATTTAGKVRTSFVNARQTNASVIG